MTLLRDAVEGAAFVFVAGKGGTGKTTAAGALALELADTAERVHLISTDPAHSLADLFLQDPSPEAGLTIEEFDAAAYAEAWLARSLNDVTQIVEGGTYLDGGDVLAFSRLALPGIDEMMAVLRLTDLSGSGTRVVVDTAPTGHTLRLLDAGATHASVARALRAMADKAVVVAGSMVRTPVRLSGERIIDELNDCVTRFRSSVLDRSAFVVATREGAVVGAETARLAHALEQRHLRVAATLVAGAPAPTAGGVCLRVPLLRLSPGHEGLREWRARLQPCGRNPVEADPGDAAGRIPGYRPVARPAAARSTAVPRAGGVLAGLPDLLLFSGKGGVGKTTCAAAAALSLASSRQVLLCSVDPAGSLDDVFGADATEHGIGAPSLQVLQIQPAAELQKLADAYRSDVSGALAGLGLAEGASLDRRVIDALWDLTPPGIDEIAALIAMLDSAESGQTVVLDTAPTGHFLRLLSMPGVALDWTRQLMRVVVKYGLSATAGETPGKLLRLSRQLRALIERIHDPTRTAVILVTIDEPLVAAETRRLAAALEENGVRVAAVLCNRGHDVCAAAPEYAGAIRISAPFADPLIGADALREFAAAWKIVE
ncbi:MAG: ArsA-related P-loop ATPase [Gemmatimonadota bacterium]